MRPPQRWLRQCRNATIRQIARERPRRIPQRTRVERLGVDQADTSQRATIFHVDHDAATRNLVRQIANSIRLGYAGYWSGQAFLDTFVPECPGCLVLDVQIPGVSGLQIQAFLRGQLSPLPVLFLSADAGHETVVRAMKAGALQFLRKPCDEELLWETLQDAVAFDAQHRAKLAELERIRRTFDLLDSKEQAVVHLLLEHDSTHDIAKSLDVSVRTVELRRSRILQKLGLRSWRQLLHFAFKVAFVESLATDSALLLEPSHSLRFLGPPTIPSPPRNRNP